MEIGNAMLYIFSFVGMNSSLFESDEGSEGVVGAGAEVGGTVGAAVV